MGGEIITVDRIVQIAGSDSKGSAISKAEFFFDAGRIIADIVFFTGIGCTKLTPAAKCGCRQFETIIDVVISNFENRLVALGPEIMLGFRLCERVISVEITEIDRFAPKGSIEGALLHG